MYYGCLTPVLQKATVTRAMTATTVNIRLPKEVADILDKLVERKLFTNRSEAIREFCREYLEVRR